MDLSRELALAGAQSHAPRFEVTVVTQTPAAENRDSSEAPFPVVRKAGSAQLWRLVAGTDCLLLAGPAILPMLFALIQRKRAIVTHHGYQCICPNGMLFHLPTRGPCPGYFAARRYGECVKCNRVQEGFGRSMRLLLLTFARRALTRLAKCNVAVSQHLSERISLRGTQVIRNGVPFTCEEGRTPSFAKQDPVCFAYVGRLVSEKGVNVLLNAAEILKKRGCDFRVLIIGDGPELKALQDQACASELTDRLGFLGFLTGEKLQAALSSVSVGIMPSIWEDVAPLSALEQMMRGRLIIGSKIGGLAEEIGDAGLTFPPGDANALADQMQRVIEQPALIVQLGKRARERAQQNYTLERMISEYRSLLNTSHR